MPAAKKTTAAKRKTKADNKLPIVRRKIGRPSPYRGAETCEQVHNFALLGMNDVEIAEELGVSHETVYAWKRQHPEFSEALSQGKVRADGKIALSLYKRAAGEVKMPAVKVSFDKDGNPLYAPYVEHLAPDVGAMKMWLYNRRPKEWRDRREVEVTGGLEHRISLMSPEERRQRLLELQAKAAQVIEGTAVEVSPVEDGAGE